MWFVFLVVNWIGYVQVAPHHDHHESYGPPSDHHGPHDTHITEFDDDVSVVPDDGTGFPHG